MDRLNYSHFNDNPNYHLVELRKVNRFFCELIDGQLRSSNNQLNFDARWQIRMNVSDVYNFDLQPFLERKRFC
jgi:hypothetical protein